MRFLILLILIYLLYRSVKSWISSSQQSGTRAFSNKTTDVVNEMVKDPVCGIYFPKRDGIHLKVKGKYVYFCSIKCRDIFNASQSK